ncbi:hypothetical protein D4R52_01855 [bacterium]|nr:MAG: hypothetical protein D4R52_01855 [bacterium]
MATNRPKIGLALSGGAGRAIAHIGVLEVLKENGIPVDYLTAASSGTLIAASYACGTMEQLKEDWLHFNKKFLYGLMDLNVEGGGSVISTTRGADWFRRYTMSKNLEDVRPTLGFVCADIMTGEPVTLALGEIIRAVQASCAVPGLFEPVPWGNKLLVDGGLLSIIPTVQAKEIGADIVIGVDIASTRYIFSRQLHGIRKGYRLLKESLLARVYAKLHGLVDSLFTKSIDFIYYNQSDILEENNFSRPGMFAILGKALDISAAQQEAQAGVLRDCDCLISPDVKHLGRVDLDGSAGMLQEGRRAALAALPEIRRVIHDYQWRKKVAGKYKINLETAIKKNA